MPDTALGIAGGLDQHNLREIILTVKDYISGPFCIDAEGRLRTDGDDKLHPARTASYIENAYDLLKTDL
jgi:hypothetical protein